MGNWKDNGKLQASPDGDHCGPPDQENQELAAAISSSAACNIVPNKVTGDSSSTKLLAVNNTSLVPSGDDDNIVQDDARNNEAFPPGYRFLPTDVELIVYYLAKKINNEPLPHYRIREIDLYKYTPDELSESHDAIEEHEWYFFTPRDRKYPKGTRPNRKVPNGYWKLTGTQKDIIRNGAIVGFKNTLSFYQGKHLKGKKTDWIMHEYREHAPPATKRTGTDTRLDYVLCRIHNGSHKACKNKRPRGEGGDGEDGPRSPTEKKKQDSHQYERPTESGNYSLPVREGDGNYPPKGLQYIHHYQRSESENNPLPALQGNRNYHPNVLQAGGNYPPSVLQSNANYYPTLSQSGENYSNWQGGGNSTLPVLPGGVPQIPQVQSGDPEIPNITDSSMEDMARQKSSFWQQPSNYRLGAESMPKPRIHPTAECVSWPGYPTTESASASGYAAIKSASSSGYPTRQNVFRPGYTSEGIDYRPGYPAEGSVFRPGFPTNESVSGSGCVENGTSDPKSGGVHEHINSQLRMHQNNSDMQILKEVLENKRTWEIQTGVCDIDRDWDIGEYISFEDPEVSAYRFPNDSSPHASPDSPPNPESNWL